MPSSTPPTPERTPAQRRREVALAGHTGDGALARRGWADPSPMVRATALGAMARLGELTSDDVTAAFADEAPEVRRRGCELSVGLSRLMLPAVVSALEDGDVRVVEAAAFALGEILGGQPAGDGDIVAALAAVTVGHADPICREAAVAALGSIGAPGGLRAILSATSDRPAVRRRAVLALASFDGPEVQDALTRALTDRDWQVRQAAEDLTAD